MHRLALQILGAMAWRMPIAFEVVAAISWSIEWPSMFVNSSLANIAAQVFNFASDG